MNFLLSTEQQALQDSATRFVEREFSQGQPVAADCWQKLADLGALALLFKEQYGGLNGTAVDLMLLCEAFGKGVASTPFLPTVFAGKLLELCEPEPTHENVLSDLIAGKIKLANAFYEAGSRYDLHVVSTCSEPNSEPESESQSKSENGELILNGSKSLVLYGDEADYFLVTARLKNSQELALYLVDAEAQGLTIQSYDTIDGHRAAELRFDAVRLEHDACVAQGATLQNALDRIMPTMLIGLSAEALGAMDAVLDMTVEYCQQREQFGKALSKQQVIQHRLVDMYMACEGLRSLLYAASIQSAQDSSDLQKTVAALKTKMAESGRFVAEQAVQLHGAIGFSDELLLGKYYKRLLDLASLYGDRDYYLEEYISQANG